jgi:anti-sigma B factor antagonist
MPDEPRRIEQGLLTIHSEPQDDARFVSLHGALDLANAKALEDEFICIEATSVSRIVLDLSELDFIDSTGLTMIVKADRRAKNDGHVLRLLRPSGQVGQALAVSGLDELLAFGT